MSYGDNYNYNLDGIVFPKINCVAYCSRKYEINDFKQIVALAIIDITYP